MRTAAALFCLSGWAATALSVEAWQVDAVIRIESAGRPAAVGDGGAARGLAQFHSAAWADCTRVRAARGLPTYPYSQAFNPIAARAYLATWLAYLGDRFARATGRRPTTADLYAMHNLGFSGYAKRGFDISRCPGITQRKTASLTR
jgi:hypothetical protein